MLVCNETLIHQISVKLQLLCRWRFFGRQLVTKFEKRGKLSNLNVLSFQVFGCAGVEDKEYIDRIDKIT